MKLEKKAKGVIWICVLSMFLICVLAFITFTTLYTNQYEYIKHYYAIKYDNGYLTYMPHSYSFEFQDIRLFETYEDARDYLDFNYLNNHDIVKIVINEMDVHSYEVINYENNN